MHLNFFPHTAVVIIHLVSHEEGRESFLAHIWSLLRLQEGDPRQMVGRCVHISDLVMEASLASGSR